MAKKHRTLGDLTGGWFGINDKADPEAFAAWRDYRARLVGAKFVPQNYHVPSRLPPADAVEEQAYIDALEELHRSQGIAPPIIRRRDHGDLLITGGKI